MLEFKHPEYQSCEIQPFNRELEGKIKSKFDSMAKPLDALGELENIFAKTGAIQGDENVSLSPAAAVVFCADHGIVSEDVSQADAEATLFITKGMGEGKSVINLMAKVAGCDVIAVDMGIRLADELPGVLNRKMGYGTANFYRGAAMSKSDARKAITVGYDMAREMKEKGYKLILAGGFGMGNSTSAAAVMCGLTGKYPELVTGRGSGLSDELLNNKMMIIRSVMQHQHITQMKPIELLAHVGGFEIGALAGLFIGGAAFGIPVYSDGFITGVSALLASRIRPEIKDYVIFSHFDREPGMGHLLEEFESRPVIDAEIVMSEACGGVLLLSVLRVVEEVYKSAELMAGIDIQPFRRYRKVTENHYE